MKIYLFCFSIFIIGNLTYAQSNPLPEPRLLPGWERITIENHGTIDLPPSMEVQRGIYKQMTERHKKISGVSASNVIFQQKDLNTFDQRSFNTYARVFIRTEIGRYGDFMRLHNSSFSPSELRQLNNLYKNEIQQAAAISNGKLLEWNNAKQIRVNGMTCVTFGYTRQLGSNPPVRVTFYMFHNYDRMHVLSFEYRISDANTWEDSFSKILNSYRITSIR